MHVSDATQKRERAPVSVQVKLGNAKALPFPHFYADVIASRDAAHETVQLTFYYLPFLDRLFEATAPGTEEQPRQVEADAYITAQVTIPLGVFNQWFNEIATRRGLITPPEGDDQP